MWFCSPTDEDEGETVPCAVWQGEEAITEEEGLGGQPSFPAPHNVLICEIKGLD